MTVAETHAMPWSAATNWVIARGALEASVAVESSDYPIPESESDLETAVTKLPLVLKPGGPESVPCEITIHFEQKFDIVQIYVRSTARVYEIYYSRSPGNSNEYLCTVRCGVAERDGKVLQTTCIEDVEGHEDCSSGSTSNGEDDWVKIKVPEVGKRSLPDKIHSDRAENIQDLYEATAQISDAEPCSSLTIKLLSLQDKGSLCVDEIYVFVDPSETDNGNETALAGSSSQNSLMAMFVPALLQISKSGASQVQNKLSSDELVKDDKREIVPKKADQIDDGLHNDQVQLHSEPKDIGKDASESAEPQQPPMANKCAEPVNSCTLPAGNLENILDQLVSRVSRVEDIMLRFEEKMLRPIESIEARLQRVELQLEKVAQSSLSSGLPRCTRISAPPFSCSESNSSSFYYDQSDTPSCVPSENEKKDLSCQMTKFELSTSLDAKFKPSLVVSAPKFTCGEDEEDIDDATPVVDPVHVEPKKALSVDDALAAALHGFLSTAAKNPEVDTETTLNCSTKVDEESKYQELVELPGVQGQEFLVAESADTEPLQYTRVLTVKAPDFSADEIGNEDDLNSGQSSLNMVSVLENMEKGHGDEMASPSVQSKSLLTSSGSCNFHENGSVHDFESENGESSVVYINVDRSYPNNGNLKESPQVNTMDSSFSCSPIVTHSDSAPDLDKDSVETEKPPNDDETNPGNTISDITPKYVLGHDSENVLEGLERNVTTGEECRKDVTPHTPTESSSSSILNFSFPILDVKFTSDVSRNPEFPLEALLYGATGPSIEGPSVHDQVVGNGAAALVTDSVETTEFFLGSPLLVDLGDSCADDAPNLEGGSPDPCVQSTAATEVSLI